MIIDIDIAERGTRPNDFTYEDLFIVRPYTGIFFVCFRDTARSLARVTHDGVDLDGDTEIAKQLCLHKLTGESP